MTIVYRRTREEMPAALIAEATVLACFFFTEIPFLWFNVIGAVFLIVLAHIFNPIWPAKPKRI